MNQMCIRYPDGVLSQVPTSTQAADVPSGSVVYTRHKMVMRAVTLSLFDKPVSYWTNLTRSQYPKDLLAYALLLEEL
jgi:hypothetical protein